MAFDTYMVVGDGTVVTGEATADGVKASSGSAESGWMEIYSFSWGASNPTSVGAGTSGLAASRVSVSSFNIMKKTDKASNPLMTACCAGQHFPTASVVMRKATGTAGGQQTFLEYLFTDVMIESIQWSGSSGGDDSPTESVSFAFAKFAINYWYQDEAAGTLTKAATSTWDLTKVKAS